ncbi:hypothetical protein OSB04_011197 [Centaurea solstitialis]|uniref:CCHC-type domain-containing protein n=1 Tax=Centaurea solstitialis TaxID=347529 RepID=A0AA38TTQ8_9ASTR|nr:hypothetical protein OSB04_011197 [Centaurea solstitialis]
MASTVTSTNNLSLRSILEKDKLTGSNFLDWERNLMIVLRHERKWYVLEEPLGEAPPANAPVAARNAHKKHSDDLLDVACLMLATMSPDLQAGLINTNAYDMIRQLRDMFQTQARTERYDATKAFNECKMVRGTSVSDHVMKMKRHLDHLERLGHPVPLQLATDTILNSLSEDYRPFVVNYNMNNMEKTIAELHSMLKTAELNMGNKNKTKDVLMVKDGGVKKKNGHASTSKGKGPVQAIQSAPKKGKGKGKGKKVKPNKARTENRCFICNEIGHWRQNCPKRHEAGRNRSSTQQLRKVAVLHIQELEVSPGSYDQLLNNSYKCCRLKVAQIFDRVSNIGRDPRLRLLLGIKILIKKPEKDMKFGKRLKQHVQETLPGWRDMYLNYKDLKKLVKLISEYGKSEAAFVYLLNNEIDKFNLFFMEQEEDFVIRHKELQQRIKRVKESEPSSQGEYEEEMSRIRKDIVDFHGEMVLLVNYSNINYTGMAKILKKYDKRTGGLLRLPFIQKVLEQPFFTTELISKLVKECEATIDELFPMVVVAEEMKESAITMVGEGIFRNTVAALMTMKEIRKGSSTQSHFSLPALNLPDTELIRSFQFQAPIPIV